LQRLKDAIARAADDAPSGADPQSIAAGSQPAMEETR